ncbi:serine/threonine protein kinase [Nostoc calcicola FACHB-3891]|nr:serine/threonine protein kinase [Nostoc calcicola FACHB-3891]
MSRNTFGDKWQKVEGNRIAEGGQAEIFLVTDSQDSVTPNKKYALKRLKNSKRLLRFKQEVETILELNQKQYPGIFPILDSSLEQEPYYFVTEYYGENILTKKAPFDVIKALTIFIKICESVSYIHENDIVHRDLKPDNIVLNNDEEPIILDFGLGFKLGSSNLNEQDLTDDDSFRLTETMEQIGSRFYIPPELETGRIDQVNKKSDSYTLGKILHFLLTGKNFARERYEDLAKALNNPQLEYITQRILSKTVIEDVDSRLSALEIKEEAIKIKRLISGGFYPNKIGSICRFCGEGVYKSVLKGFLKVSRYDNREIEKMEQHRQNPQPYTVRQIQAQAYDTELPVEGLACDVCGHIQFFNKSTFR